MMTDELKLDDPSIDLSRWEHEFNNLTNVQLDFKLDHALYKHLIMGFKDEATRNIVKISDFYNARMIYVGKDGVHTFIWDIKINE